MFCCCVNPRRNCCCRCNCDPCRCNCCRRCGCNPCCCNRCCPTPARPANASGEAFTLDVHTWEDVEVVPVEFDGFRLENMRSGEGNTALIVQRGGCYSLEYLVNVSDFEPTGGGVTGVDVFMSVNGNPLLPPVLVNPRGIPGGSPTTVATDKRAAVQLNRGDRITLMLHPMEPGDLTITPTAWLEATRIGDTC